MASEWHEVSFEELLAEPVRNGLYKAKEFHGRGAKIVNMGELFAHPRLRSIPMKRVELSASEESRFLLAEGDLIFARRSLTAEGAGKCSVVLELDEPTTFESSIIRARPDKTKANSLYLYYFFNSPNGFHALDTIRRQVAVAGITGSDLAKLKISTPPIEEQRAIAHILSVLDDRIELNRRMNQTLEAMARALFKSWFVDFDGVPPEDMQESALGFIPKGWRAGTLADFVTLNPETWKKQTRPDEIFYVDLSNTKWGRIESVTPYVAEDAPSRAQRVLRPNDTIVGTVRPGNGSCAFIDEEGLTGSTGFAVLRPKREEYAALVYIAATAPDNIDRLANLADGGAYPAVRPEIVVSTSIAVADEKAIAKFSQHVLPMLKSIAHNERKSRTLAGLRDTLLPRLISGQLRVNQ
jgi:type I restriction enzyme S subunit